jgi:hypothetical protein
MRWIRCLLLLASLALADWKVGVWWELTSQRDSATAIRYAGLLVQDLNARLRRSGGHGAVLERLVMVREGRLPLAGSDPQEHPDLRDSAIDLEWGVPAKLPVPEIRTVQVAWLHALGCPDPSTFAVGWDLFRVQENGKPLLGTPAFALQQDLWARAPGWNLTDSVIDPLCMRLSGRDTAHRGPRLTRIATALAGMVALLPDTIRVQVRDGAGLPFHGRLDLWRGRADAVRPFAALFDGAWDSLSTDTLGRLAVSRESWFGAAMTHGASGSNLTALVRASGGGKMLPWRWLDARDLILSNGSLELRLPSGSSRAWQSAARAEPGAQLVAVESDTSGVWVAMAQPNSEDVVVRVSEAGGGRALFRSKPIHLTPGVWEKRLPLILSPGAAYELRLDMPRSRTVVRFVSGAGVATR